MQAFLKHPFDLSLQLEANNVGPGKQNEINWIFPKLSKMKKMHGIRACPVGLSATFSVCVFYLSLEKIL